MAKTQYRIKKGSKIESDDAMIGNHMTPSNWQTSEYWIDLLSSFFDVSEKQAMKWLIDETIFETNK